MHLVSIKKKIVYILVKLANQAMAKFFFNISENKILILFYQSMDRKQKLETYEF